MPSLTSDEFGLVKGVWGTITGDMDKHAFSVVNLMLTDYPDIHKKYFSKLTLGDESTIGPHAKKILEAFGALVSEDAAQFDQGIQKVKGIHKALNIDPPYSVFSQTLIKYCRSNAGVSGASEAALEKFCADVNTAFS